METVYDWLTVAVFASLVILFLHRPADVDDPEAISRNSCLRAWDVHSRIVWALKQPRVEKSWEAVRDTGRRKDPVVQPQNRRNELSVN